ncbi:DUF4417 domain-containing protein [Emergencia timonensis]|uniref:DUF4417 domain-containing protein n=1 Tax=Emergencia timonensis TaxID=1776384 RepID=UPI00266D14B3|nr:DUF4417 domain-containing protein [Emergencia timonensis]
MKNLCERNCDICNLRMYCHGCSLCEMPFCKFDCEHCFSLCPRKGASWRHLSEVGGGQINLTGNPYRQLPEFPWQAIIAPNYSVYEDAPRIDHLYNIKRSSIVYNELLAAGLPAVPDVSWYNKIDLDQWIQEINRKDVKCIAFSFQTVGTGLRASNLYVHYLTAFKYLTERIPAETEIIVAGMVSAKRVQLLLESCQNPLSILNQSAYVHSRRGILSETGKAPGELGKNEILLRNLAYYAKAYRREEQTCRKIETVEPSLEEPMRIEAKKTTGMNRK